MAIRRMKIAVDIDDVVADSLEATRLWANQKAGVDLQPHHYHVDEDYWSYYNRIWASHGIPDTINFDVFMADLVAGLINTPLVAGAAFAIKELSKHHDIVLITSRPPAQKAATQQWLDENLGRKIPLYFSKNPLANAREKSKGELCVELGVELLIDDNLSNCQNAIDYGIDAVVFGFYGWNEKSEPHLTRCNDWPVVLEYVDARR